MPSSVIADYSYNADTATLRVRFVSGLVYDYKNVPATVYKTMKATTSKGSFLNLHIKGKYDFEKVTNGK